MFRLVGNILGGATATPTAVAYTPTRTTTPTRTRTATPLPSATCGPPVIVTPAFTPGPGCSSAPPPGILSAVISMHSTSSDAVSTNNSTTCSYPLGLAVYRKFNEVPSDQELYDYRLAIIPPNSTLALTVSDPTCAFEVYAFWGPILLRPAPDGYGARTLATATGNPGVYCTSPCHPLATATPTSISTATPTSCAGFSDVHPTDYFYTPVQYLVSHGVISGYSDCTFRPYNNSTRSQMVKIMVLGFQKTIVTPTGGNYTFHDVPPADPFFPYVETAAAHVIVSGYNCGGPVEPCDSKNRPYFRPHNNVTRGQLSKIDVVAAGWPLLNPPAPGSFGDVLPNSAFYEFVETAYCHSVVSGYICGGSGEPCDPLNRPYFRPNSDARRGQIAKIAYLSITNPQSSCGATPTPHIRE